MVDCTIIRKLANHFKKNNSDMRRLISAVILAAMFLSLTATAHEGMWLPMLLNRNYKDMKKSGLKLKPKDIYDVNNSSIKDAIVSLGGFCTAEIISAEGLMLTNHHCGYDAIRSHSTVENDYLTNGFWAMSRDQEIVQSGANRVYFGAHGGCDQPDL
jgi:hypothetical protein